MWNERVLCLFDSVDLQLNRNETLLSGTVGTGLKTEGASFCRSARRERLLLLEEPKLHPSPLPVNLSLPFEH